MFWIVLSIIILIIIAFFFTRLKINIKYDKDLSVVLRILFFKFKLYPERPPKKSMSYKELKKLSKRLKSKEEKQKLKQLYKSKKNKQVKKKKFSDIVELIKEISALAMLIIERLFKYLRVKVKYLDVVVATGDPATTAISYAAVCSTLNIMIARIENSNIHYSFNNMECRCDYLAAKSSCKADIEFKIRIWQAIYVSLYSLVKYLSTKNKTEDV